MNHEPDLAARPLIIGGMHRSGTSLTASLFASAGINLGPELLGANDSNPSGHFEDCGVMRFHARSLAAHGICTEGYTADARGRVPATLAGEALDLLAARQRPGVAWGWKEPRTTLFLDFWQEQLPEARHVFVFRRPWEVADSLFRRGDEAFALNPRFALDVWTHYNRLILDFVGRHPDRCAVFEISQVIANPQRVFAAVRSRLGVPLGRPAQLYNNTLFTHDDHAPRAALVRALAPETWRTYEELRELAGSGAVGEARPRQEMAIGENAVLEWARASRAEVMVRRLAEEQARLRGEEESRRLAEDAARRLAEEQARRRPWVHVERAVRHARNVLLRQIGSIVRRLLPEPLPEPRSPGPALLPFPRDNDAPATRRAA